MSFFVQQLIQEESRQLTDRKKQNIHPGIYSSVMQGLTLEQYIKAKLIKCSQNHESNCKVCAPMIKAGTIILDTKYIKLPVLWNMVFQNQRYDCQKAQRRFLQMPLVSVNVAGGVYLCEKKDEMDFDSLKNEIIRNLPTQSKTILMPKEEFNKILDTTESEAERHRLKHTIASAYNLSRRQASSLYNIARMQKRATDISEASQKVREIYEMHNYLAKIEQRAFLISHGVNCDSYIQTSSSESESESEDDEAGSIASEECQNVNENSLDNIHT